MACNRRSGTPSTPPPPLSVPILFIYRTIRRPSEKSDYTISPVWHIVNPLNGCDVVIKILVLRLFFSTRKAGDEPRRVVPAVRGLWRVFIIVDVCFIRSTCLNPIYSRAGGSTISYVHSYHVRNTLLRINYLSCLVSTMASGRYGPYHCL
jgi:hypothetical protein